RVRALRDRPSLGILSPAADRHLRTNRSGGSPAHSVPGELGGLPASPFPLAFPADLRCAAGLGRRVAAGGTPSPRAPLRKGRLGGGLRDGQSQRAWRFFGASVSRAVSFGK